MAELPNHVVKYLEDNDVDPNALTEDAKEALADLSPREIALLKKVGDSLQGLDTNLIAKVH